ncbi:hypothetical protein C8R44DRAFT_871612 [Mycena epipterygia]|nr:hypothetical protein C8R44DRAFT_871612 [Mycena epipterygia]
MEAPTALPRTTHMLKHDQRVRLMRSTRQFEGLFGETPLFVNSPRAAAFAFLGPRNFTVNVIRANEDNARPAAFIYAATPPPPRLAYTCHRRRPRRPTPMCDPCSRPPLPPYPSPWPSIDPAPPSTPPSPPRMKHAGNEHARWPPGADVGGVELDAEEEFQAESRALIQACALRPRRGGRFRLLRECVLDPVGRVGVGARHDACAVLLCPASKNFSSSAPPVSNPPLWPTPPTFIPSSSSPHSSPTPPLAYSSPAPPPSTKYEPASAPTTQKSTSSSPVRYDRGTPVRRVSYAVFPPVPLSSLAPLSSSAPPVGYQSDTPYNGGRSSYVPCSPSSSPTHGTRSHFILLCPVLAAHVKFDAVGHDQTLR